MKKNVKNGQEAVKPQPTSAGQSVLPFFISSLINGNYFCLDTRDMTLVIPTGYRVPGFKSENSLHDCKYKTLQGSRVASQLTGTGKILVLHLILLTLITSLTYAMVRREK